MREVQCACGAVAVALQGTPIGSFACYCDTCQEGSRRLEELPNASALREPDGGTAYVIYRKDRVAYTKGQERVHGYALEQRPKTQRVVATCCNSALLMRFDDARHWVALYHARFGPDAPPIERRICTRFLSNAEALPNDVPSHPDYPPAFMLKLLRAGIAMLFRR